jgi:dolichyl-diphosphooligosaccharide---protein glycosyltransferase
LLGKALTSDLDDGYEIARHLADYVLVWGGGGGDDLAKSPHLARIATSVYRDHCPDDPTCRAFGFVDRQGTPSTMMRRSLLYRLHGFQIKPDIDVPDDKFQEVYRSQYGKVRIYKIIGVSEESKQWVTDTRNRRCDSPGSWFCPGQYPPGIRSILSRKTDFRQLEDFNRAGQQDDSEYQQQYFRDLQDPEAARRKILEKEYKERLKEQQRGMSEDEKRRQIEKRDEIYSTWSDTEDTTTMWRLISTNDIEGLKSWLDVEPNKAFIRSKDGRGPMWWAFEQRNEEITKLLMKAGVPHTDVDTKGLSPLDLLDQKS